jgi:Ca2+-binding RTX toxin-like protein
MACGSHAPLREEVRMRRFILLLTMMAAMLVTLSGIAVAVDLIGTNGPDTLKGTNGSDNLLGRGGDDVLYGFDGRDNLLGGDGKDLVLGGDEVGPLDGDKNLVGGAGNDRMNGGEGFDDLMGGGGNDRINGESGPDRILGQAGDDYLLDGEFRAGERDTLSGADGDDLLDTINRPAKEDIVSCGRGFDRVLADANDAIAPDCEKVAVGPAAADRLNQQLENSGFFERFLDGLAPFPEG